MKLGAIEFILQWEQKKTLSKTNTKKKNYFHTTFEGKTTSNLCNKRKKKFSRKWPNAKVQFAIRAGQK